MTYRIKQDDWDYLAANNVFLDGRDDDGYAWSVIAIMSSPSVHASLTRIDGVTSPSE